MKKMMTKFLLLTIAVICSFAMFSCASSEKANAGKASGETAESGSAANEKINAENKSSENKSSDENAEMTQDGLPKFKKGDDYKTIVREKMLKANWKPARSKQADWCGTQEIICDKFDEYESRTKKDLVSFRWQKGNKFVEILTVGETQSPDSGYKYDGYALEKDSMTVAQNERWKEFWDEFKTAINKKDKEKLKYLMTEKIDGGGAVETAEERIAAIESSDMWASMQKTVGEETKIDKCEKPCRASKDGYLIFEYDGHGWWKWSALGGEGGEL